jgi:UDP-N-acetylglucosamine 2-epimerase
LERERIFHVGNIMIDTLQANLKKARESRIYERHGVVPGGFALLTLHRPSNVDNEERLRSILFAVTSLAQQMPVLFPIHPRKGYRGDVVAARAVGKPACFMGRQHGRANFTSFVRHPFLDVRLINFTDGSPCAIAGFLGSN